MISKSKTVAVAGMLASSIVLTLPAFASASTAAPTAVAASADAGAPTGLVVPYLEEPEIWSNLPAPRVSPLDDKEAILWGIYRWFFSSNSHAGLYAFNWRWWLERDVTLPPLQYAFNWRHWIDFLI